MLLMNWLRRVLIPARASRTSWGSDQRSPGGQRHLPSLHVASICVWGMGGSFFLSSVIDFWPSIWIWTWEQTPNHTPKFDWIKSLLSMLSANPRKGLQCNHVLQEGRVRDPPHGISSNVDGRKPTHDGTELCVRQVGELRRVCLA
jgi:hypothetical protein